MPRLTSLIAARLLNSLSTRDGFVDRAHAAASDLALDAIGAEAAPDQRILFFDERLEHAQLSVAVDGFFEQFAGAVVLRQQRLRRRA